MCDQNSNHFKDLFKVAGIEESRFVRTTDADHKVSVQHLWNRLVENGAIVKGSHSGYYSTNDETFYPEKDLVKAEDGSASVPGSREVLEYVTEENYVFQYDEAMNVEIAEWASDNVTPQSVRNKLLNDIKERKLEISVSRPSSRLSWGIRTPNDES